MSNPLVHGLIPAAGSGVRFDGTLLKQYQLIAGKSVLLRSIEALHFHPMVSDVTVILSADDKQFVHAVDGLAAEVNTAIGGNSRAQSVLNGLSYLADRYASSDWVLVHDAARPCLSRDSLDLLLEAGLNSDDGAILALPVADTLKRSGTEDQILETVNREHLWAAQTPQLFRLGALMEALKSAQHKGLNITDEASAMEFSGARPKLVMGTAGNIKITWPGDLQMAEAILSIGQAGVIGQAGLIGQAGQIGKAGKTGKVAVARKGKSS